MKSPSFYTSVGEPRKTANGAFLFNWANDTTNMTLELNRHEPGSNYLRGDGHAEFMLIPELSRSKSAYNKYFFPRGSFEWPGTVE